MRESLLQFLWRWRRFDGSALRTTDGQSLELLHPGEWNTHAGPDFFNARLRIGDTTWAGNVEMHVLASEWLQHGHGEDPAYDNVVLHVVLREDAPIRRRDGSPIPSLELQGRIPADILARYQQLEAERAWIPCQRFFGTAPDIIRLNWLDRLLVERLEGKTEAVAAALEATNQHWEEAFYRLLARNFGLKVNAEPFEALARSLPLLLLAKHKNNLLQLEALLFGQAGMLDGPFRDEYPRALAHEYQHLAHKYQLRPLPPGQWKFLRLRPANFPTLRLAQFAALAHRSAHLFSQVLEATSPRSLAGLFQAEPSAYWLEHFQFDKPSARRGKALGADFVNILIINTIVPFLFLYGKEKQLDAPQKMALRILEELPAESNAILDGWAALGQQPRHAAHAQALLQLKTRYCDQHRCLECAIGTFILK